MFMLVRITNFSILILADQRLKLEKERGGMCWHLQGLRALLIRRETDILLWLASLYDISVMSPARSASQLCPCEACGEPKTCHFQSHPSLQTRDGAGRARGRVWHAHICPLSFPNMLVSEQPNCPIETCSVELLTMSNFGKASHFLRPTCTATNATVFNDEEERVRQTKKIVFLPLLWLSLLTTFESKL